MNDTPIYQTLQALYHSLGMTAQAATRALTIPGPAGVVLFCLARGDDAGDVAAMLRTTPAALEELAGEIAATMRAEIEAGQS